MGFLHFDYLSEVLGYHTNIYFILPACTHEGKEPRATLYLLHGGGGNGLDWIRYTALEQWAEKYNIAVVLPEVDGSCFYADMKYGYNYFTYITKEVVTVAQNLFPVNKEADKRLVAGLSMGGYGAFKWAFNYPDFFSAAANLSGISLITDLFNDHLINDSNNAAKNLSMIEQNWGSLEELVDSISDSKYWIDLVSKEKTKLPKLFAGIGTEDFSYNQGLKFISYCKEKGIDIHYEEMPGNHEWKVWDAMLGRFLEWALVEN